MNPNDQNNPPAGGQSSTQPDFGSTPAFTPPATPPAPPSPVTPPIPETPPAPAPTEPPPPPMTPLDNPLQAPPQPPAIDSGFSWSPPPAPSVTTADLYGPSTTPSVNPPPPEAAPTDLSHLVANNNDQPVYTPPVTQPETLVTPPNGAEEVPNVPIENHDEGMPKWVIGLGLGILLAVLGTSGYFILGIGKAPEQSSSLPATTKKQTITPPPSPIVSPSPATTSATFGGVSGTSPATSAADLLKQRQSR